MTEPNWLERRFAGLDISRPHWLAQICREPGCGGRILWATAGWEGMWGSCDRCGTPVDSGKPGGVLSPPVVAPVIESPPVPVAQAA